MIGVGTFNNRMRDLYNKHKGNPVSTQMIEEFLLCNSGNPDIVDAFHRFVYALDNPSPVPDLWLRDDPADPGADLWGGTFWDSPDLWIRNNDDGGTAHQSPEFGQDNWFHARVRNKAGGGNAAHFVVTFHSKGFAGTEFVYPNDFLPCIAAKAEFDLAAGATRIVKAKWPRSLIPPTGTHTCMLASLITRSDHPINGRHVWEDNNLAQKNLMVVNLEPEMFIIIPIVIRNWINLDPEFDLEVWRPVAAEGIRVSLIHKSQEFFKPSGINVKRFKPEFTRPTMRRRAIRLECGAELPTLNALDQGQLLTSDNPELLFRRFGDSWEAELEDAERSKLAVNIPTFTQNVVGLKIAASDTPKMNKPIKLHFVQRNVKTKQIVGGVAIQVGVGGNHPYETA